MSEFKIKRISTRETLPLRHKVLKPYLKTAEECVNPGDDLPSTFHFGLYSSNALISVATFIQEAHENFPATSPYRLRGMATSSEFQGQGCGSILVRHAESELRKLNCDFIWFNARIKAFSFYEKLGFQHWGELFEIPHIGPHKVMYKKLIPS